MTTTVFENRSEAGKRLAGELSAYGGREDVVVLGLPRGGVVVAYEVALALEAPLDLFMVRKLGVPSRPEVALGAIATGDVQFLNYELLEVLGLSAQTLASLIVREKRELARCERAYRERREALPIAGCAVILVDDGVATGSSVSAAVEALRMHRAARIVVAIPVGAEPACDKLRNKVDELVCLVEPETFQSVGEWYEDFDQVTDREVRQLLRRARELRIVAAHESSPASVDYLDRAS
ncbi:MAG TPA: phosphoribosyltransferase family protein [Terriglobia bacterium]|nr:phosphoribosyltransferase family protein [Terriglobia bacterium]